MANNVQNQKDLIAELEPLITKIIDKRTKNCIRTKPMPVFEAKSKGQTSVKLVDVDYYDFISNKWIIPEWNTDNRGNAHIISVECDSDLVFDKGDFVNVEWDYSLNNIRLIDKSATGGSQTQDYNVLYNKPQINGVTLTGNKTALELGIDGDKTFVFRQDTASSVWSINHNLGKFPSVMVVDTSGNVFIGDIKYKDENNLVITFSAEFAGKAYCN